MKKVLAVTALVALVASPALAQSEMGVGAARPGAAYYVGPLGPNADWSNIYIDNYGGSRLVRVPNSRHQPYGAW
jgi:hypothetical protein